jgi:1-carboxybiuret hydrolase
MMDALADGSSAETIAAAVQAGAVTAMAVVEAALARIDARDPAINAFTAVARKRARSRAQFVDDARRSGSAPGALAGVPFAVKAMIEIAGVTTSAGSALYRRMPAATRDAEVVRALESEGAICLGALNMDEFGMGGTTESAHFGPTRNPHDLARTPGGSSGGSAAALAAGMVPITLGGDALGSIRLPASLCGVFGLRPTRGSVSDAGVLGSGGTIGTIGPMARSVADLRCCHAALRSDARGNATDGPDQDQTTAKLRIGVAGGYFRERLDQDARGAVDQVVAALNIDREVDFPQPSLARAAATLVNASESATGKLQLLRTRLDEFDPGTRDRFLAHALVPAQWYLQAQRFRRWHNEQVRRMFTDVDVVIMPATPCVAPLRGAPTLRIDGTELPTGPALGWFTQPLAGTDCPALTVPVSRPHRLPIGVQLFAPPNREAWLFQVADQLEALGVARAPVAMLGS